MLNWPGRKQTRTRLIVAALAAVFAFTFVLVFGIVSWIVGGTDGLWKVDEACRNHSVGCNAGVELLGGAFVIALGSFVFRRWQINRAVGHYLYDARTKPWHLLQTATKVDRVVGRTGICDIIEKDLAEKRSYRPQVIVAGAGDGKTAVLMRLTQILCERGAVPVPIRLRDAQPPLDFVGLAKERFMERVGPRLRLEGETERVWRELCADRLIVILADGLEEAIPDGEGAVSRERAIALAIDKARDVDIPLVIASRPDAVLERTDVSIVRLEPLPVRSVVEYIRKAHDGDPDVRIEELVETAEVMERPLYLKLARELYKQDRLGGFPLGAGRVVARFQLLERWREWLVHAAREVDARVQPVEREEALQATELMACVAMADNKLEVDFERVEKSPYARSADASARRAKALAPVAERLDLVEVIGPRARFQHSVMQAYLGARYLPALLDGDGSAPGANGNGDVPTYLKCALNAPGRELMMALVMCCFADDGAARAERLRAQLCRAASDSTSHSAFELLAAAYEIDTLWNTQGGDELLRTTCAVWAKPHARQRNVETTEAKLRTILPISEAGRRGSGEAYRALWELCRAEDSYAVRFQAAQALAAGGSTALAIVEEHLDRVLNRAPKVLTYTDDRKPEPDWQDVREGIVLAWIMPLLAATCRGHDSTHVRATLERWIDLSKSGAPGRPRLHLGVEAALAQGFKWEANRMLPRDQGQVSAADDRTRNALIDLALELLDASDWWQTEVVLLQALALWALDAGPQRKLQIYRRIAGYRRVRRDWRLRPRRHPLVREAASLGLGAVTANVKSVGEPGERRRGPSRHIWIDEVGVAAKIGPRRLPSDGVKHLWIPPAAGWNALNPSAQRLIADILLFLNLIEGDEAPPGGEVAADRKRTARTREREERRRQVHAQGAKLPSCLARVRDRGELLREPSAKASRDAETPACANQHCQFGLCPYPAQGRQPFRGNLNETFCRAQRRLLRRPAKLPRWVDKPALRRFVSRRRGLAGLRSFWERMEERDQGL